MKRVFIIHGWEGSPEANWLPWMKRELKARGFQVNVPAMPDTDHPRIDAWVGHLQQIVKPSEDETYFIGHSVGCQTIARYLAKTKKPVAGVLFVAGWLTLTGLESDEEEKIMQPWLETPINYEAFRSCAKKVIAVLSDDDPFVPLENAGLFRKNIGAEVVVEKGAGHFTGEETGVMEFPAILEAFLKLANENSSTHH